MNLQELAPRAEQAEAFLKAMANRHRLMILCELHKGERSVTALQETIGLAHTILVMRDGVVTQRFDAAPGHKPEQVELIAHMV